MRTDEDVDRLLHDEALAWRATVPVSRVYDMAEVRAVSAARLQRSPAVLGLVGATVAVIALATVTLSLRGQPPGLGAGTNQSNEPTNVQASEIVQGEVVRVGDRVIGSGHLVAAGDEMALCALVVAAGPRMACVGSKFVPVLGLAREAVPGHQDGDDDWVSDYVEVLGRWTGDAVQATGVRLAVEPPGDPDMTVPCPAPPGGWPGIGTPDAAESAQQDLDRLLTRQPDRFVGLWPAVIPNGAGDGRAIVVGTVDDPAEAGSELSGVYPFNLCIVKVTYSNSDLDEAARHLVGLGRDWNVRIDPALDRVVVRTAVLDESTLAAVAPVSERVIVRPIVRPAD